MKNQKVVTLLSERKGTLREQIVNHINMRVKQAYPDQEFASESGSIPSTIRDQAMRATNVESHSVRKHDMHDGKQSADHICGSGRKSCITGSTTRCANEGS
eukprot:2086827-Karenia_brevis.AAC.1